MACRDQWRKIISEWTSLKVASHQKPCGPESKVQSKRVQGGDTTDPLFASLRAQARYALTLLALFTVSSEGFEESLQCSDFSRSQNPWDSHSQLSRAFIP